MSPERLGSRDQSTEVERFYESSYVKKLVAALVLALGMGHAEPGHSQNRLKPEKTSGEITFSADEAAGGPLQYESDAMRFEPSPAGDIEGAKTVIDFLPDEAESPEEMRRKMTAEAQAAMIRRLFAGNEPAYNILKDESYRKRIFSIIAAVCAKHNAAAKNPEDKISADIIRGLMAVESGFRGDLVSPAGAVGLMQLDADTWRHYHYPLPPEIDNKYYVGKKDIKADPKSDPRFNPELNVKAGVGAYADRKKIFVDEEFTLLSYAVGVAGTIERIGQAYPDIKLTRARNSVKFADPDLYRRMIADGSINYPGFYWRMRTIAARAGKTAEYVNYPVTVKLLEQALKTQYPKD